VRDGADEPGENGSAAFCFTPEHVDYREYALGVKSLQDYDALGRFRLSVSGDYVRASTDSWPLAPRGRRPVDTILQHECLADEPPHRSSTNPQLSGDSWLTITFDIESPHVA
jgi:hypothetical protein